MFETCTMGSVSWPVAFTLPTRPVKYTRYTYCLPGSCKIQWVRQHHGQYLVNVVLIEIKDPQTSKIPVKLKRNLYVGTVNISLIFDVVILHFVTDTKKIMLIVLNRIFVSIYTFWIWDRNVIGMTYVKRCGRRLCVYSLGPSDKITLIWVTIGSGNGLLPDGIKP